MSVRKEAVVFVPGLAVQDRDFFLDCISTGLTEHLEITNVKEVGEAKIAGNSGKRFELYIDAENIKIIDIYEAYWADLFSKLSEQDLKSQFLNGTYLLFYWLFGKIWASVREAPTLFIGIMTSLLLLFFWYYGILAMALTAIGQDPNFLNFIPIKTEWAKSIGSVGTTMGGWSVWLIVSGLLNLIPVKLGVDIADFTRRYLDEDMEGSAIKAKIRQRVSVILNDVLNEKIYERVTILAHSFGVVVATDMLADYYYPKQIKIRYISLGGPLKVLSYKSGWVEKEIKKCLNNNIIDNWIDFYSDQDWMCTKTPIPKGCNPEKIQYQKNNLKFSLFKQLSGKSHTHYFTDEKVLKTILDI